MQIRSSSFLNLRGSLAAQREGVKNWSLCYWHSPCFFQGSTIPINQARPNRNLTLTRKEPIGWVTAQGGERPHTRHCSHNMLFHHILCIYWITIHLSTAVCQTFQGLKIQQWSKPMKIPILKIKQLPLSQYLFCARHCFNDFINIILCNPTITLYQSRLWCETEYELKIFIWKEYNNQWA